MTDTSPNQVRAFDRIDEFDDVLHYIQTFPNTVPASQIRAVPGQTAVDYVWEDHMDINPTTGEISVDRLPNMEFRPTGGLAHEFPFVVAATDGLNVTLQEVMFEVEHVVENPVWGTQSTEFSRVEGTFFSAQFSAFDPEQGVLTYTVSGLSGFNMSATGLLTGTVPANATALVVDRPFVVTVTSSTSGQSTALNCVLHITNDNQGPVWSTPSVFNIQPGNWTVDLSATDREGDTVTYELEGTTNQFFITGSTLARAFPEATQSYSVVVTAISGKGTPREKKTNQSFTVNVTDFPNDPPIWVTPSGSIAGGEGGSNIDVQLRATDTELVTYAVISGALPNGLSMSATGRITGTLPVVSGGTSVFTFTVNATDGENFVPRTFSISATRTNNPPVWNTNAGLILDLWAGQTFDVQLSATDPEGSALSYTISKPSGLSWLNMTATGRVTGRVPVNAQATTSNLEFTVNITDGVHVVPRNFQVRVKVLAAQTIKFNTTSEWIVPEGCYQIMFPWVIAGGGGGGAGHQYGNGGGGGGGGSGGRVRHAQMDVTPGDVIKLIVGAGGAGSIGGAGDRVVGTGGHGGDTIVQNGSKWVISATGGRGGAISTNWNQGYIVAPGGDGGLPDGTRGTNGPAGTGDRASSPGGAGANGPTLGAFGGLPGIAGGGSNNTTGPSTGKPGQGYGSGGGGGGNQDRAGSVYWRGGNGAGGFVEFTFPSQGVITDEASPHFGTKVFVASSGTGGGSGGDSGGGFGGGGSCAWVGAVLPSGKTVSETVVGDDLLLLNKEGDGYFHHPVTGMRFDTQPCFTIVTESGIELTVSDTTPIVIKTEHGYEVVLNFSQSILMERVPVLDNDEFRWELVMELKDAGVLPVGLITADNGVYASGNQPGRYIFTHNMAKQIETNPIFLP